MSTTPANSEVVTNNYLDNGTGSRARTISTNSFTQQIPNGDISIPREKKVSVSLNPLPAERWVSRSSEEREKSSSAKGDEDDEDEEEEDVSAGSCGDVEDNLDDVGIKMDSSINFQVYIFLDTNYTTKFRKIKLDSILKYYSFKL